MRSTGRRAALSGVLALLALAVLPAGPAAAHATVTVTSPTADEELVTAGSTVTGQVTLGTHPLWSTTVDRVTLTLALAGRPDITATDTPSGSGAVSFPVTLTYNGKYDATMRAPWKHTGLDTATGTATSSPLSFLVAVPPARPTEVKTAVDATSRAVAVTWKANSEPDLIRYEVKRAKGTSNDFTVVGKIKAGETAFVDNTTAEAGGDYRYLVVAVRNGIPGRAEIASDPSTLTADATAKVPDPPPPPTTAPPATTAAGTAAAGATGTASSVPAGSPGALATSGSVDLSGFNTVRSQTRTVTPRTLPLPDPGFQSTLPFDTTDSTAAGDELAEGPGDVGGLAADSPQFRELGAESSGDQRARTMAVFAAGLLCTVLLMHLLWVRGEVKRVPLEALEPEGLPAGAGAATARRAKRGRPAPGPTLEDSLAADFAPVVVAATAHRKGRTRQVGTRRQKVTAGV